jgi:hypothetical protein
MKILPGLTFSWKRAIGLSQAKAKVSRQIGIPLTRSGLNAKVGRLVIGAALGLLFGRRR